MPSLRAVHVVAVGLSILFAGIVAGIALGHAELDAITPADKSTVAPPTEIVATFTEPVNPTKSSIKLVDAAGNVIADGSTVQTDDAKAMRLAVSTTLAPGVYTVRWTTASALDGDLDHGTTTFTVAAAPSLPPSSPPSAPPSTIGASASAAPSASIASAPSPSAPPTSSAASSSDAVIPVVVALVVMAGLGLWLTRGRSRAGR